MDRNSYPSPNPKRTAAYSPYWPNSLSPYAESGISAVVPLHINFLRIFFLLRFWMNGRKERKIGKGGYQLIGSDYLSNYLHNPPKLSPIWFARGQGTLESCCAQDTLDAWSWRYHLLWGSIASQIRLSQQAPKIESHLVYHKNTNKE